MQTLGEEIANAVNHGIGFHLAVASLPILVHVAAQHGGPANVAAASVFSATMMLLYLVSTLYPRPAGRARQALVQPARTITGLVFIAGSSSRLHRRQPLWGYAAGRAVELRRSAWRPSLLDRLPIRFVVDRAPVAMGWVAVARSAASSACRGRPGVARRRRHPTRSARSCSCWTTASRYARTSCGTCSS